MQAKVPDRLEILQLMRGFQPVCVLGAAAELDLFTILGEQSQTAEQLAEQTAAEPRAMTVLLDALAALNLLTKQGDRYAVPAALQPLLANDTPETVLPMVLHSMNIMRYWAELAGVVKTGSPAARHTSIRGREADRAAFIAAMHSISAPDGRRPGGKAGKAAISASIGRGRGVRHMDPGLAPCHAPRRGHHLRPPRRDRTGPRAFGSA